MNNNFTWLVNCVEHWHPNVIWSMQSQTWNERRKRLNRRVKHNWKKSSGGIFKCWRREQIWNENIWMNWQCCRSNWFLYFRSIVIICSDSVANAFIYSCSISARFSNTWRYPRLISSNCASPACSIFSFSRSMSVTALTKSHLDAIARRNWLVKWSNCSSLLCSIVLSALTSSRSSCC